MSEPKPIPWERQLAEAIYWEWDRIETESEKLGDLDEAIEHHISELEKILNQKVKSEDEAEK